MANYDEQRDFWPATSVALDAHLTNGCNTLLACQQGMKGKVIVLFVIVVARYWITGGIGHSINGLGGNPNVLELLRIFGQSEVKNNAIHAFAKIYRHFFLQHLNGIVQAEKME